MFSRILAALDGSEHARKAARVAVNLAKDYDARLVFLTVTRKFDLSPQLKRYIEAENLAGEPQYLIDEMTKSIMSEARDLADEAGLSSFDTVLREGQPARTIADFAKTHKTDLIVMGCRGLGDVESVLIGSVSHKVLSLAPCMVLTIK